MNLTQSRNEWGKVFIENQPVPSFQVTRASPSLFPYRKIPFGQHSCQYGRYLMMGEPSFAFSQGRHLRSKLDNFMIRLRLFVSLLLPSPLGKEECRSVVPLVCRLPLSGGLRAHWGESLGIRCQLHVSFGVSEQRSWLKCWHQDISMGSSGPLVGNLEHTGVEVVALAAFGSRLDVGLNGAFLQWVETIPYTRRCQHWRMEIAPWLASVRSVRNV